MQSHIDRKLAAIEAIEKKGAYSAEAASLGQNLLSHRQP